MKLSAVSAAAAALLGVPGASALSEELRRLLQQSNLGLSTAGDIGSIIDARGLFPALTTTAERVRGPSQRREQQTCTLCYGGGTPSALDTALIGGEIFGAALIDDEGEEGAAPPPFSTCGEARAALESSAESLAPDDDECLFGQRIAYLYCGCPESPPLPSDGGACGVCPEGAAIPASHLSKKTLAIDIDEDGSPNSLTCADAEMSLLVLSVLFGAFEPNGACLGHDSADDGNCTGYSQDECKKDWETCYYDSRECEPQCLGIADVTNIEFCQAPNDGWGLDEATCGDNPTRCWWDSCVDPWCNDFCYAKDKGDEDMIELCELSNDLVGLSETDCENAEGCVYKNMCDDDDRDRNLENRRSSQDTRDSRRARGIARDEQAGKTKEKAKHRRALQELRRAKRTDNKDNSESNLIQERRSTAQHRAHGNTAGPWNGRGAAGEQHRRRRAQDEGTEEEGGDLSEAFCPMFQAVFSGVCGCPTAPPRVCPICSSPAQGSASDPYSGFALDKIVDVDEGSEMSCGALISIWEAMATDSICDEAPLALKELGCGECDLSVDGGKSGTPTAMPTTEPASADDPEKPSDAGNAGGATARSSAALKGSAAAYASILFTTAGIVAPVLQLF